VKRLRASEEYSLGAYDDDDDDDDDDDNNNNTIL